MDVNSDLLQWFINFWKKNRHVVVLKLKLRQINNLQKNYTN